MGTEFSLIFVPISLHTNYNHSMVFLLLQEPEGRPVVTDDGRIIGVAPAPMLPLV
jgi:hypothetical protein